ncbi:hypothetical protein ABB26_07230 [Stenotrophomonas humi]|uniref:Uncharacterized protein n=1 Tax=Stenotrophomonas humi TaxID=405444 RepID=A0A0R0C3I9_9GAMM|nr:hypothetical protein [Stenotrophomonas humi]KRG64413.1 hypothetical protein ABB26_07230 [Stenotrophomonas humi]
MSKAAGSKLQTLLCRGAFAFLGVLPTVAAADVARGPAGSFELPEQITFSVEPANEKHPNPALSSVLRLTNGPEAESAQAAVTQTCSPGIGGLNSKPGIERLAAATLMVDTRLQLVKPGEWTVLDSHPAYRTELSNGQGTLITQWMIPLETHFAWIKFERLEQTTIEQGVLAAIDRMQIHCGLTAAGSEG